MGWTAPPLYGKSKFYEKKKEKALNKIEKLKEIIAICDLEIKKANANKK